jgi:hypothetical protein
LLVIFLGNLNASSCLHSPSYVDTDESAAHYQSMLSVRERCAAVGMSGGFRHPILVPPSLGTGNVRLTSLMIGLAIKKCLRIFMNVCSYIRLAKAVVDLTFNAFHRRDFNHEVRGAS